MKLFRGLLLWGGLFCFLACDTHTVQQIEVKVPPGVEVPAGMTYIPAGPFIMGDSDEPTTIGGKKVATGPYLIDIYEVSRQKYAQFDESYEFNSARAEFPVTRVTYEEAQSYCRALGKRLPTEKEWEKAARGVDGRKWPWEIYFEHPNNGFSGFIPEPVDKRRQWISPYGVYGMGHNVWEWTSTWYRLPGQGESADKMFKVIRGGLTQTHLKVEFSPTWFRNFMKPNASFNFIGFRCAQDVTQDKVTREAKEAGGEQSTGSPAGEG